MGLMVRLRRVIVTALAVATGVVCVAADWAAAAEPADPTLLFFTGTDVWRYGTFLYTGGVWSPAGLDSDGFVVKTLLNGGEYTYTSGDLHKDINVMMGSAAILPGWRFTRDGIFISVFAGPVVQDYRLTPYDPGGILHGFYVGGEVAAEVWYQPSPNTMAMLSGAIASIGPTGSLRAAFGFNLFGAGYIGPETQELWCGDFQEVQFGGHVTGLRTGRLEWSTGGGWSLTSDHRSGPYVRLGVNVRF